MQSQVKILYVDDHEGLRNCLGTFIAKKNKQIEFVFAKDEDEALKIFSENPEIQTAIIDLNLGGSNGLNLVDELRKINSNVNILIYTMFTDLLHVEQSLRKNIQGFITKDCSAEEFEKALILVANGNLYFNKTARNIMKSMLIKNKNEHSQKSKEEILFEDYQNLTKAEKQIFELVANNKNTDEIATQLKKSAKTVRNQISEIYQKMSFSSRTEIVNAAKKLGVVL